jgi:hypothetical protein
VGKRIFVLLLYVNDILGIVDEKEAKMLKECLVVKAVDCHIWEWILR